MPLRRHESHADAAHGVVYGLAGGIGRIRVETGQLLAIVRGVHPTVGAELCLHMDLAPTVMQRAAAALVTIAILVEPGVPSGRRLAISIRLDNVHLHAIRSGRTARIRPLTIAIIIV